MFKEDQKSRLPQLIQSSRKPTLVGCVAQSQNILFCRLNSRVTFPTQTAYVWDMWKAILLQCKHLPTPTQ